MTERPAIGRYRTFQTEWLAGLAYIPAVKYEPMMCVGQQLCRYVFGQSLFGSKRCLRVIGQTYTIAYSEHMCVNRHSRFAPHYGKHHIGCLTPHPGYSGERVYILRQFTSEVIDYLTGCIDQMPALVIWKSDAAYIRQHLFGRRGSETLGGGVCLKQKGCDHIHPLVRALSGQYHGQQQVKRGIILQFGGGRGHYLCKDRQHPLVSLFNSHALNYQRAATNSSRKRTSFSENIRRSLTLYFKFAIRSMPIPKA